jgi:hypothetical protein
MLRLHDLFARWDIALCLPLRFDSARLLEDLGRMDRSWWGVHRGPYHDGRWEMIALRAPAGELSNQTSRGGEFTETEAGRRCHYLPEVLGAFPGRLNRVRFLRLRAGGRIHRHSDPMHRIDPDLIRIHVPVLTNDDVAFHVDGRRLRMREGEAWIVDVRFPHEVWNGGQTDRIHLVIDLVRDDAAMHSLLAGATSAGKGRLGGYFLKHALPGRVRRLAGIGN